MGRYEMGCRRTLRLVFRTCMPQGGQRSEGRVHGLLLAQAYMGGFHAAGVRAERVNIYQWPRAKRRCQRDSEDAAVDFQNVDYGGARAGGGHTSSVLTV